MEVNPFHQFEKWFSIIKESETQLEPNMMVISTIGLDGYPDSRHVLLKEVKHGHFVFFTNYNSEKGHQIAKNNKVSLLFFWPSKVWAVRIQGDAEKLPDDENDAYFKSRPFGNQASSILSHQSEVLHEDKEKFVGSLHPRIRKSLSWPPKPRKAR